VPGIVSGTMNLLLFLLGLAALIAGASLLVRGAAKLALSFGISPLVVGLTIVAFGTSAPEMAVSVGAALDGKTDIAVGNVVGSNIFNVLFILGISALIAPLAVHQQLIRQEVPVMIGCSLLLVALAFDGRIGRLDAALLSILLITYTVFLIVQSRRQSHAAAEELSREVPRPNGWDRHWSVQLGLVAAGLVLLVLGSDWLVTAAVAFARVLGVSDAVIGLTIVAAGTSMPEVAASVTAALKGERDIAVGNVIGSNTFNILGCLGVSGLVAPEGLPVASSLIAFDLWVLLAVAFACLPVLITGREIARWEGAVFLFYYCAYATFLILETTHHAALPRFSAVMQSFVLPLTIITLLVVMYGHRSRRKR
jgi:cation:H+ antiporter